MKKFTILLTLTCSVLVLTNSKIFAQIKVLSNGNIGINNGSPTYKLDVNTSNGVRFDNWTDFIFDWSGLCSSPVIYPSPYTWYLQLGKSDKQIGNIYTYGIHANGIWLGSDDSIKTNKRAITNAVGIVKQLTGKQYNYTTDFLSNIPDSGGAQTEYLKNQYGFMARELITVLPELVAYDSTTEKYSVNYIEVIPILTEAIKAQQSTIDSLHSADSIQIHDLNSAVTDLQSTVSTQNSQLIYLQSSVTSINSSIIDLQNCCNISSPMTGGLSTTGNKQNKNLTPAGNIDKSYVTENNPANPLLFQNTPNPFNAKTEIKYYLPVTANSAMIVIYNLSGQQLLSFPNLHGQGIQSITIDGGGLSAGSYYYTLLVDGKEIDTRKMILIK